MSALLKELFKTLIFSSVAESDRVSHWIRNLMKI